MNLKNLLRVAFALVLLTILGSTTFAQTTYYVNNQTGLDGYDGLHANVTGVPGQGPKRTISNAITAASASDVISVEAFAAYNETIVVNKKLTFAATGGTVTVTALTLNNAAAAPADVVTFTGPYSFTGGVTLTDGKIAGGNNVTVGTALVFTIDNGVSVDAQLNFSGSVAFTYADNVAADGGNVTSGFELPAAGNTTNFGSLTTAALVNLTLNESKVVRGNVVTGGTLKLGGGTLTLSGAASAHNFGGNVSEGTLDFSSTSDAAPTTTVAATAVDLPNIIVSGGHANGKTVTINTSKKIGNLTITATSSVVNINNATEVGDIINHGVGSSSARERVFVVAATIVGNVTNSGVGSITLNAAKTIGAITNSARRMILTTTGLPVAGSINGLVEILTVGQDVATNGVTLDASSSAAGQFPGGIVFNGATKYTINGNILNSASINNATYTAAGAAWVLDGDALSGGIKNNYGCIEFLSNTTLIVNGDVVNNTITNASLVSVTGAGIDITLQRVNEIKFWQTTALITITGKLVNSATGSATLSGPNAETWTNNGNILFACTGAGYVFPNIENSSNFGASTANSGLIFFPANANAMTVGNITNTSASSVASNGAVVFNGGAGALTTGNILSSGAAGGDIQLPNGNLILGSVTNSRTAAGADILLGTAAQAGVTVTASDVVNSGAAKILFQSSADGNVTLSGKLESTAAGTVQFTSLTTGTVSTGVFTVSAGTVDFSGAGAATGAINSTNVNFTGGAVAFGTGVRNFTVSGSTLVFGNASGVTAFTNAGNTTGLATTLILAAPTPTVLQGMSIGAAGIVWPGHFTVNNTTGLAEAVHISGGNMRVLGNVSFTAGYVVINGLNQRLFIGREVANPTTSTGNFTNTAGYRTENNAFVSINGVAAAVVAGAGNFGNFEVDAGAGAGVAGKFVSIFNLANGNVTGGAAIVFDNAVSFPTIVRNAGTFAVAPTFTSKVNVYYIGTDKATANELPVATDKLNDLTVATTNGAVAGKGVVDVAVATTINGTLTINANQALRINTVDVTMKGASVILNGDLVNVAATDYFVLSRAAGTTITGAGWLPDIQVAAGSAGNVISGAKGLVTNFVGANGVRGGGDDFDPTASVASGDIVYLAGTNSLSVTFAGGALNGTHVGDIVTAGAGNTLTLAANTIEAGELNHVAGNIVVPEGVTWTYRGVAPAITGGAGTITGAGTLLFLQATGALTNVTLTVGTAAGTIAVANVNVNLGGAADLFTVAGNPLTLSGAVTVTRGNLVMAQNVTCTGSALTLTTNSQVSGGSVLRLNAAVAPLTFTYTGTPTITNLRISNDVVLAGTGTTLTVSTAFTHDGGELNFADRDLTITGTFTRTAGTYKATTGYLIISGGSFAKGASNFTIPNLRIASGAAFAATGAGVVTVLNNFDLQNGAANVFTHTVATVPTLAIDNAATVKYVSGTLDVAPVYAGSIKLVAAVDANRTIPALLWTAGVTVTDLTVNNAGFTATIPDNRTVTTVVNLTAGTLATGAKALTTNENAVVNVVSGIATGTINHGANTSVNYAITAAYPTTIEIPATVKDLTIARTGNVANAAVTLNKAVTVTGNTNISNDLTMGLNGVLSVAGDVTIANATNTNASATILTFVTSPLTFVGTTQNFALGGNRTIANVRLNQAGSTVNMTGGNLNITTDITFDKGVLVTGDNIVILPTAVQGFTHNAAGAVLSHIYGPVQKSPVGGATGRFEFPVGTLTAYRPVSITFLPANPLITATNLRVKANATTVGTTINPAITINGVTIDEVAEFSWDIVSTTSLGPSQTFDIEFEGKDFTHYTNVADIRVASRLGNVPTNPWVAQGGTYQNFEFGTAPNIVPVVRVTNSTGNLVSQGGTFALGWRKPVPTNFAVTGTVTYDNAANTPLAGVVVTLNPGGATATTDAAGAFAFANVANGTYTVTCATTAPWAGANSTDALLVAKNFAGLTGEGLPLAGLKLAAANVNASGAANNTDALLILTRFGTPSTVFALGDWIFSGSSLTVNGAAVVHPIKALAVGDVNGSNTFGVAKASAGLTSDGVQKVNLKDAFEVPVKVTGDMNVGAMSLKFNYPAELVQFESVSSKLSNIKVTNVNGVISIAWADLSGKEAFDVKDNGALVTLKFKPTENFKAGSKVDLSMEAGEVANKDGKVLNAMLKIAQVEGSVPAEFALKQNYPNPFNPSTTVVYDLPVDAKVNLVVFNSLGEEVATLVNNVQSAGSYKVEWNAKNMTSGIYFYRINVEAGERSFVQTNKMILMK